MLDEIRSSPMTKWISLSLALICQRGLINICVAALEEEAWLEFQSEAYKRRHTQLLGLPGLFLCVCLDKTLHRLHIDTRR